MWLDGIGFAPPLEDPTKSRVVGKVGYGVMPKGPMAQASATFGDGIGVAAASAKKEAGLPLLPMGGLEADGRAPAAGRRRRAVPQLDPQRCGGPQGRQDAGGLGRCGRRLGARSRKLGLPVIVPVTEFRDIFGIGPHQPLSGGDPAAELKKATEQFKPVLDKSEKA